jgi:hypothetical protein
MGMPLPRKKVRSFSVPGQVAQAHQIAVLALAQDQPGELLGGPERPLQAHAEDPALGLQAAGRELQVLGTQRRLHVGDGQAPGGERVPVEPDAHGIGLVPAHPHPGYPVQDREAVHQEAVGIVGELGDAQPIARQVEPDHRVVVAVDLLDLRGVGLVRELIQDPGDPVADVVGRPVDVAAHFQLDGDDRAAVLAHR